MIDSASAIFAQAQASASYGAQAGITRQANQLGAGHIRSEASARKSGQEFEAMFLGQMVGQMFEGIKTDGMFGGGHGEEMFRSLLVDEYAKEMTKAGGIGIADAVTREILRVQEGK